MDIGTARAVLTGLCIAGAVPAAAFIAIYGWIYPWWSLPSGRHMMAFTAVIGAALTAAAMALQDIRYPGDVWGAVAVLAALAALLWHRLGLLLRSWHSHDDR